MFDVVKLNINELGRERLSELVQRLEPYEGKLVAEKLSTQADHEFCVEAGCDLFQGYFFCRPAVACTRGIAANRLALLQVAAALNDPTVELEQIEQLIAHDVALSFRLLRYVNSAFFGLRGDVRSIGQALALLGLENIKRWATLSVLAEHRRQADRAHGHRAHPRPLLRARRRAARDREPRGAVHARPVLGARRDDGRPDGRRGRVAPAATEMREALVSARASAACLLQCVAGLETGEVSDLPEVVHGAGELYLEAMMWANSAAESLFSAAAPDARAKSTPPPVSQPAPAPLRPLAPAARLGSGRIPAASSPRQRRGPFARAFARLFGWFGRHASHEPPEAPAPCRRRPVRNGRRARQRRARRRPERELVPRELVDANARTSIASGVVWGGLSARAR